MSIRHEIAELPTTTSDFRKFGLLVGGVFTALGAFAWWRDAGWSVYVLGLGVTLVLLGAVAPRVLRPAYMGWMAFAVVLGFFVTRVLLTLFFFLVVTPVALFFRLIGRDALHRKIDRQATTYWIDKEYLIPDRKRFEKFF